MEQRAAGYFRISHAREDMRAPQIYRTEIERYCSFREWNLAHVFSDIDYSARKGARGRPGLEQLKNRRREFSWIVVPKLSRFGRSVSELMRLFDLFDDDGISLVFLDMNVDSKTSQGRLLRHVMAAFAEYESDVKSDYARASYRSVMEQGRPWGGRAPFGYLRDRQTKQYVVDGRHAATVREIYARYVRGESQGEIARQLNALGRLRASGAWWSNQLVGRVLDNPAYASLCLLDDKLIGTSWPPLVGRDTWDMVQRRREARGSQVRVQRGRPRIYLLSGLIFCGHCGHKLYHYTKTRSKNGLYRCPNSWYRGGCLGGGTDAARADAFVTEAFLGRVRFSWLTEESDVLAHVIDSRAAWESASLEERRRVLQLAIERIELVPWPDGRNTPPRRRTKEIEIRWAQWVTDEPHAVSISHADDAREDAPRRVVSDGRVDQYRGHALGEPERKATRRSEASRRYYREWREHCGLG